MGYTGNPRDPFEWIDTEQDIRRRERLERGETILKVAMSLEDLTEEELADVMVRERDAARREVMDAVKNHVPAAAQGKGHVPEAHLFEYRKLKHISDQFKSLGDSINTLSYADSSLCYFQSKFYLDKATALRVDIPKERR